MSTRVLSKLRSFSVCRGFLEIFFLPKFQKKFSYKTVMILCHTSDLTKFQTLQRVYSIPTLSKVLFYSDIDESRDRFAHFMQSEPRGKVGSFFDFTCITLVVSAPHYQ